MIKRSAWSSENGEGKKRRDLGTSVTLAQSGWSQAALERISFMLCRCDPACTVAQT